MSIKRCGCTPNPFLVLPHEYRCQEPVRFFFADDVFTSDVQHWVAGLGGKAHFVGCAAINCEHCLRADRPVVRYQARVCHDGHEKILEVPFVGFSLIYSWRERLGHRFLTTEFEAIRKGKWAAETVYSIFPHKQRCC